MFIQTKDETDFNTISTIKFLKDDFTVNEDNFKLIPENSLVVLDDFSLSSAKESKLEFLKVVNYYLRHHRITLFLIIHNIYNNGLLNEILLAPHLFIAYSNLGYYVIRY